MIYVLNSTPLQSPGLYRYQLLTLDEVKRLLASPFVSAVGHKSTAEILTSLTGFQIDVNRIAVDLQPGDAAVVCKIKRRLNEGEVLTQIDINDFELGLLTRLE